MDRVKQAQQLHALRRAFERYGLLLTMQDLRVIASTVASGRARPCNTPNLWLVRYGEHQLPVVYNGDTDAIVTIYPPRTKE